MDTTSLKPRFNAIDNKQFSKVLRERVSAYFKKTGKTQRADTNMHVRTVLLLISWIGIYCLLVFGNFALPIAYLLWAALGVMIVWVTINIGHDAIHGSYTTKKWLRNLLSHTFNINGASVYMWKISHNQAHHNFTNIHGHDEDISPAPFIRISPGTKRLRIHRYQHIYSFFFYSLATISWLFAKDYVQFFGNHINNYEDRKHPLKEYFYLFFYKFLTYALYLIIPLAIMPYAWGHILGGFLLMHLISGFYLAIIFMLAHGVEEVQFPNPSPTGEIENDWAIHQLSTTANFAPQSSLTGFLTGGLNLQVEHHLFPHIATVHYRPISKIVKATADEYGIPYCKLPTFWDALKSHYRFLKKLGKQEDYVPIQKMKVELSR